MNGTNKRITKKNLSRLLNNFSILMNCSTYECCFLFNFLSLISFIYLTPFIFFRLHGCCFICCYILFPVQFNNNSFTLSKVFTSHNMFLYFSRAVLCKENMSFLSSLCTDKLYSFKNWFISWITYYHILAMHNPACKFPFKL